VARELSLVKLECNLGDVLVVSIGGDEPETELHGTGGDPDVVRRYRCAGAPVGYPFPRTVEWKASRRRRLVES